MELFRWETSPWGQQGILGISWDLLWLFLAVALLFVAGHALYAWRRPARGKTQAAGSTRREKASPERVVRHPLPARLFHWTMAASMLALVATAFLPVTGVKFAWVVPHWIAGLVLLASVLFHVVHALVWQDVRSIWFDRRDLELARLSLRRLVGRPGEAPAKPGKYPVANKAFHLMVTVAGLVVIATGLLMTRRVETPLWPRDPYFLEGAAKAAVYVLHGLAAVAFVGLIVGHVYFAIRPENLWITRSMIRGWITRSEYLGHHDPARWPVPAGETAARRRSAGRQRSRSEEV
ncbi:cytochrome b/b6 domain-containing protein [Limnochorda pilosa]|uniref:Cytochrome B n=1 Tax=Limnochorda pilosa TaxID=1555112 RepID=A0A0K2SNR2_LIMPI|nr:cytochrome b/b6 domain-containing protein [Limnochorda pilosa]BAS28736.1 cytochrome B [Limnochorda pilosa]